MAEALCNCPYASISIYNIIGIFSTPVGQLTNQQISNGFECNCWVANNKLNTIGRLEHILLLLSNKLWHADDIISIIIINYTERIEANLIRRQLANRQWTCLRCRKLHSKYTIYMNMHHLFAVCAWAIMATMSTCTVLLLREYVLLLSAMYESDGTDR